VSICASCQVNPPNFNGLGASPPRIDGHPVGGYDIMDGGSVGPATYLVGGKDNEQTTN